MVFARDFLELLNHEALPLFNSLNGDGEIGGAGEDRKSQKTRNSVAKQLYNTIMWLIIAWDAKSGTPLLELRSDIVKYKKITPIEWKVKRVNSATQNGGKVGTFTEIIDGFRKDNNVSLCQFALL